MCSLLLCECFGIHRLWKPCHYTEPAGALDSSLKKHTTLLNRLRSALLTTSPAQFIKEIDGLALTKYVDEIVAAVVEGVGSARGVKADVEGAVEVSWGL